MQSTDFELATHSTLSFSPTWTLSPANSIPAGNRRRIVDLAGVIVPGTYQIAVAPFGSDKINGLAGAAGVVWLVSRFSYLILETDGISNWAIVDLGPNLLVSNNLSDLSNAGVARGNLGLGSAAVHNITDFMMAVNNLSELINVATARVNLGLGVLATVPTVLFNYLDPSIIATSADVANATPGKLVPSNVVLAPRAPVIIPFSQANGLWDFSTFVNGIWTIGTSTASPFITINPTNIKPGQGGFIVIHNGAGAQRTVQWPSAFNPLPPTGATSAIALNSAALFEYWTENSTLVRIRVTLNI